MKRLVGTALTVLCVLSAAACTTSGGTGQAPPPQSLPATPLDGWVRVATVFSTSPVEGYATMRVSPNGQFIVYETDDVLPGDTDAHPNQRNLYLLDRSTGIHHLIRDWLATASDVGDDGRVVVSYREGAVTPLLTGTYTIADGIVPLTLPSSPVDCTPRLEDGGTGFELGCNGTDTQATGLYRFDAGDAVATPVAVAEGLPVDKRIFVGTSPNRRYLEIGSSEGPGRWVYDDQTDTLFPHTIIPTLQVPYFLTEYFINPSVGVFDDGRFLLDITRWGSDLEAKQMAWYDPRTGDIEKIVGYGNASTGSAVHGTDFFVYADWTREIGRHFWGEGRAGQLDIDTILGTFSSPTARWLIPDNAALQSVTAGGDVIVSSALPLDPNNTSSGVGIFVREGPLPAPPQ